MGRHKTFYWFFCRELMFPFYYPYKTAKSQRFRNHAFRFKSNAIKSTDSGSGLKERSNVVRQDAVSRSNRAPISYRSGPRFDRRTTRSTPFASCCS